METLLGLYSPSIVPMAVSIAPSICAALGLAVMEDSKSGLIVKALSGEPSADDATAASTRGRMLPTGSLSDR